MNQISYLVFAPLKFNNRNMTNDDFSKLRGIIKEEVTSSLKPVNEKLDVLWDQTIKLTEDMDEVKDTLKIHTASLKRIEAKVEHHGDNIARLDKRATTAEKHLGIVPPPELTIVE